MIFVREKEIKFILINKIYSCRQSNRLKKKKSDTNNGFSNIPQMLIEM